MRNLLTSLSSLVTTSASPSRA